MMDDELSDLYIKQDLDQYANVHDIEIDTESRWPSVSRSDILEDSLSIPHVECVTTGSYQGTMVFAFEVGGYIWLLKESYGSCSYCDPLQGALSDDDVDKSVRSYATRMLRNALAFESTENAVKYIDRSVESDDTLTLFGWSGDDEDYEELKRLVRSL